MTVPSVWPTGTDVVTVALHGRVAVITLDRPDRRNALHPDMHDPITRALEEFATRDDVGCVVLTGAGTAFCAGGDVKGDMVARARIAPTHASPRCLPMPSCRGSCTSTRS